MVFFTCYGCGEAVKKAQVEKHRWQCRRSTIMSCIDCSKDFHGDQYQSHNKCVSEDQKYGGQNYVGKMNKGEIKQEKWYEQVQKAIDSTDVKDNRLKSLLIQVKNYPNVPRKQQKFRSFLSNSLRIRDQNLVDAAWKAIAACMEQEKDEHKKTTENEQDKTVENGEKRKAEYLKSETDLENPIQNGAPKRRKLPNSKEESQENGNCISEEKQKKFKWRKALKAYLTSNGGVKRKRLQKAIIAQYKEYSLDNIQEDELKNRFDQAIDRLAESGFLSLDGKFVIVQNN